MRCKLKSSWIVLNLEAINILWQILWLRNTHIIAGGEGFTGLLIMTKLLNILKQELDPLKTTTPPFPTAPLEISPGKKCNYRQIHDAILKANPAQRVASLISNTDPHTPSLQLSQGTQQ